MFAGINPALAPQDAAEQPPNDDGPLRLESGPLLKQRY